MKRSILILSLLFGAALLFASFEECDSYEFETHLLNPLSTVFRSSYGSELPTSGTFRALTIFVNIIFDQSSCNVRQYDYWIPDVTSSINNPNKLPTYLLDLFDIDTIASPTDTIRGIITRIFAESSFNNLILLSDFMVVNIYQSQITPERPGFPPGRNFGAHVLMDSVITFINRNGGLNTIFEHNSISDYDKMTPTARGQPTNLARDYNIDFINFMVRNGSISHGGFNIGTGTAGRSITPNNTRARLRIGNSTYGFNMGTFQSVGGGNITATGRDILTHEIAHFLLGGNNTHTSGGIGRLEGGVSTFIGRQHGYGLYAGMPAANAFERWRLDWRHPTNIDYRIAARGRRSDITQACGAQTFYLRDFVTYGDAIRIKLPYKDSAAASNQYIWLVNHQMTRNNKMDSFLHTSAGTCRDVNTDGIIAFHQVGRDVLEGNYSAVFHPEERDNLRMISAGGNYNLVYMRDVYACLPNWGWFAMFKFASPNPLQGASTQTETLSFDTSLDRIRFREDHRLIGAKYRNGVERSDLVWYGVETDIFVPNPVITMDISTNPPPVNVLTYYSIRRSVNNVPVMDVVNTNRNTRRIYLTGLSIRMIDPHPADYTGMRTYRVEIRWDDYNVKQDVRWTGDIVMKEQLNLLSGNTIYLEQNRTPNQTRRDPVSMFFAPPTRFTAKNGSIMNLERDSRVILREKSSFILESGANLTIQDGAEIIVQSGSTFMIQSGANLTIQGSGRLTIEEGAYLCVEDGANIRLQEFNSVIAMMPGAFYGAHLQIFPNAACLTFVEFTGAGAAADFSRDVFIQNTTITNSRFVGGRRIYAGRNVTTTIPQGDVNVTNNSKLILEALEYVILDAGFEVLPGADLEIR